MSGTLPQELLQTSCTPADAHAAAEAFGDATGSTSGDWVAPNQILERPHLITCSTAFSAAEQRFSAARCPAAAEAAAASASVSRSCSRDSASAAARCCAASAADAASTCLRQHVPTLLGRPTATLSWTGKISGYLITSNQLYDVGTSIQRQQCTGAYL